MDRCAGVDKNVFRKKESGWTDPKNLLRSLLRNNLTRLNNNLQKKNYLKNVHFLSYFTVSFRRGFKNNLRN